MWRDETFLLLVMIPASGYDVQSFVFALGQWECIPCLQYSDAQQQHLLIYAMFDQTM